MTMPWDAAIGAGVVTAEQAAQLRRHVMPFPGGACMFDIAGMDDAALQLLERVVIWFDARERALW